MKIIADRVPGRFPVLVPGLFPLGLDPFSGLFSFLLPGLVLVFVLAVVLVLVFVLVVVLALVFVLAVVLALVFVLAVSIPGLAILVSVARALPSQVAEAGIGTEAAGVCHPD